MSALLTGIIEKIDGEIKDIINTDVSVINDIRDHSVISGGKRIRAIIHYLFGKILGASEKDLIRVGAICEIIHTATLLHDDVIDNNGIRRKHKSAKSIWGNKTSILTGDYLLARALQAIIRFNNKELNFLFSDTVQNLAKGELLHMYYNGSPIISMEKYNEIIQNKTASLFIASAISAGMLAKVDNEMLNELQKIGLNLGMLFQIKDDIIDYTKDEEEIGKVRFNDLINKTPSYPMILLFKQASNNEKEKITAIMKKDRITTEDKKYILSLIKKYKVDEQTKKEIKNYYKKVINTAVNLTHSQFKDELLGISAKIINF